MVFVSLRGGNYDRHVFKLILVMASIFMTAYILGISHPHWFVLQEKMENFSRCISSHRYNDYHSFQNGNHDDEVGSGYGDEVMLTVKSSLWYLLIHIRGKSGEVATFVPFISLHSSPYTKQEGVISVNERCELTYDPALYSGRSQSSLLNLDCIHDVYVSASHKRMSHDDMLWNLVVLTLFVPQAGASAEGAFIWGKLIITSEQPNGLVHLMAFTLLALGLVFGWRASMKPSRRIFYGISIICIVLGTTIWITVAVPNGKHNVIIVAMEHCCQSGQIMTPTFLHLLTGSCGILALVFGLLLIHLSTLTSMYISDWTEHYPHKVGESQESAGGTDTSIVHKSIPTCFYNNT